MACSGTHTNGGLNLFCRKLGDTTTDFTDVVFTTVLHIGSMVAQTGQTQDVLPQIVVLHGLPGAHSNRSFCFTRNGHFGRCPLPDSKLPVDLFSKQQMYAVLRGRNWPIHSTSCLQGAHFWWLPMVSWLRTVVPFSYMNDGGTTWCSVGSLALPEPRCTMNARMLSPVSKLS